MGDMEIPRRATKFEITALRSPSRTPIDWSPYADGEWWLVHEGVPQMPAEIRRRAVDRTKQNVRRWAARNGMRAHLRWKEGGRMIWVRFEREGTHG
jgi:hypothetical protein